MLNESYNIEHNATCYELTEQNPPELQAFASCLNSEAKFNYTIAFLLLPLVFYLTEFLMLRPEYEPTGLRQRIIVSTISIREKCVLNTQESFVLFIAYFHLLVFGILDNLGA